MANGIFGTHHSGSLCGTPSHPVLILNYGMPPNLQDRDTKKAVPPPGREGGLFWKTVEDFLEVTKIGRVSII